VPGQRLMSTGQSGQLGAVPSAIAETMLCATKASGPHRRLSRGEGCLGPPSAKHAAFSDRIVAPRIVRSDLSCPVVSGKVYIQIGL
jgi:hypothetical protein